MFELALFLFSQYPFEHCGLFSCRGGVGYSNSDLFVLAMSGWLTFMSRGAMKKSACFDKPKK